MGNVVLVIAQKEFRDKELVDTKDSLQSKGFQCDIASKTLDKAVGSDGLEVMPDLTIQDVLLSLDMYRAVVFIGGKGMINYFDDKEFLGLAKIANNKKIITAAVCIAPMILAKAGVLDNKKATVWNGDNQQSAYFQKNNIEYTGETVTVDGNIVTGNGPDAAKAFGEKIAELL